MPRLMEQLQERREVIMSLAARHGVHNVRVFGSVARGDDRANSDVDFLVTLDPARHLKDSYAFKRELSRLLHRKVDVVLDGSLPWYVREGILAEAKPL
ncbi:nucleotidyltransferase family protein [Scytonema tolypothrichoides VB-61278]|nr:nucleotidyltransferase family protein [Scytonema tolypothrichoides VB-61278]